MDNASEFCLDVQEMYASGNVTIPKFQALVVKYGGSKREDGITFDFNDGSVARWDDSLQSWQLNPK